MSDTRPGRYDDPSDHKIPPAEPMTPEEAQAAYDAAPAVPLSDERIQEIVAYAVGRPSKVGDRIEAKAQAELMTVAAQDTPGPQTHEEARQFHEGFLSGATAYAAAVGHSELKRDNPKLCEVFDAQGWRTVEMFEKIAGQCEHGVKDGDWCEPCNREKKLTRNYEENR